MTPAARLQAAIDILQELEITALPADRFLRDWFRRRRYAGSKDRAAIAARVFDVLRHRNSFAWRMQSETPRALVIASLLHEGQMAESIRHLFSGEGYGPPPLSELELLAMNSPPKAKPPLHVRGEYPQWLEDEFRSAFATAAVIPGERTRARSGTHRDYSTVAPGSRDTGASLGRDDRMLAEMRALQARASVDLRVNTLKTNREDVLRELRAQGYDANPTRYSPFAIRVPAGPTGLDKTELFVSGGFELQDEASQIAALLVDAKPGMRVLDLAAGAGGKSLAIAAQMRNEGVILAFDDHPSRLKPLPERAARAGASCITVAEKRGGPLWGNGKFDRVVVDAPCSGTGTWRRQPELRWRLTPERLESLKKTQAWLLEDGARHTKPSGRLIYATCSLLPCENEDHIAAFVGRHSDFTIVPAREVWRESIGTEPPSGMEQFFRATPLITGMDGFFAAVLERS